MLPKYAAFEIIQHQIRTTSQTITSSQQYHHLKFQSEPPKLSGLKQKSQVLLPKLSFVLMKTNNMVNKVERRILSVNRLKNQNST